MTKPKEQGPSIRSLTHEEVLEAVRAAREARDRDNRKEGR